MFRPKPRVKSLAELNAWLEDQCIAYAQLTQHPEFKDRTIWQVFQEERTSLMELRGPFDGPNIYKKCARPSTFGKHSSRKCSNFDTLDWNSPQPLNHIPGAIFPSTRHGMYGGFKMGSRCQTELQRIDEQVTALLQKLFGRVAERALRRTEKIQNALPITWSSALKRLMRVIQPS